LAFIVVLHTIVKVYFQWACSDFYGKCLYDRIISQRGRFGPMWKFEDTEVTPIWISSRVHKLFFAKCRCM